MTSSSKSVESVTRKYEFLRQVIAEGTLDIQPSLADGLLSQASFAALINADHSLNAISLNNLKNTAEEIIVGGFATLDSMRRQAHSILKPPAPLSVAPRSDSKAELIKQNAFLKRLIVTLQEDNMHLTYVIRDLHKKYRAISTIHPQSVKARYEQDTKEIHIILAGIGQNVLS